MIYKAFKNISLSRLGMGCMRLPMKDNDHIDYEAAHAILERAYRAGINYFDTAYVYQNGDSERCLGAWMGSHPRDSFYIASKFHIGANPDYEAVFEEQLQRLGTDHIDFYLLHCLMDNNLDTYLKSGAIQYFQKQKELGRISCLGFSSHAHPDVLSTFVQAADWDFAQIQMNFYDWNYSTTAEEYRILEEAGIPIMVMEPVRGGRLAKLTDEAEAMLKASQPDWSIPSWALRFVASHPQVQVILSGMSTLEQLEDNLSTFSGPCELNDQEMTALDQACEKFRSQIYVPCTGCRYCTPECPMGISIPEFLTIYNSWKVNGPWALQRLSQVDSEGKPTDCVACGACAGHCPQSIDIPKIMAELAEKM